MEQWTASEILDCSNLQCSKFLRRKNLVEAAAHCKELVCTYSFRLPKAVRNATPKSGDVPASQRPKPNRRRT
jgi:hypothetical protein